MVWRVATVVVWLMLGAGVFVGNGAQAVAQDTLAISAPADITTPATTVCGST